MNTQLRRSRISGVGAYVPEWVVKNDDLKDMMETSDEWIRQRTGIEERRWVRFPGETTSDLALQASERAIAAAGIDKSAIGLIVFATLSPDHDFPGTGCFLQTKLGLSGVPALDIRQQCSGFLYGLSVADQYVRNGVYEHVLVVGAEVHSLGLDKTPRGRDVSVLFGDGAGAVVVSATTVKDERRDPHVWGTYLHADGRGARELWLPAPGVANGRPARLDEVMMQEGLHFPKMNGKKVFTTAVRRMAETLAHCLERHRMKPADVDLFLFHQANLRINEAVAQQLGLPSERVFNTIQKYGNTTAATIPLGIHDAVQAGRLKPGMTVAMAAFGSGFTWASGLLRFG
jgi:3-oxoacyl-[acyl-carrier-protein] synthase-3